MKHFSAFLLFSVLCFSAFAQPSANIRINQIGFYTYGPKMAAVVDAPSATTFYIRSSDQAIRFTGQLGVVKTWAQSGENVQIADFSGFGETGNFILDVPGLGYSYTFDIRDQAFGSLNKALIKAYYFNRNSTALEPQYAGKWERPAGHPDVSVIVHPSAASTPRPAGTRLSCPKGWYDAGDYNSYIINSGISTYTLLLAYEQYASYYDTLFLNIPESQNNLPDILDEIKWNLDWMLTMQDPNDGGVYNKKTTARFSGSVMPEEDIADRYVVTKSTPAAFDFAAVMAVAYRIYKRFDPNYATTCLEAAKKAYTWGVANPNIRTVNPPAQSGYPAISTGGYGDSNLSDELEWASNELYIATGDDTYYASGFKNANTYNLPDWQNIRMLGLYSLLQHRKDLTAAALKDTSAMRSKLLTLADGYLNYQKNTSPYKIVMGRGGNNDFVWGSNAFAGNQAMLLLNAYHVTRNTEYATAAVSQVDYLVGRNATGYCFVTGQGSNPTMNIHHRQSEADGIADPVPGFVAGGPNPGMEDAGNCGVDYPSSLAAKAYLDDQCSYASNEIAINWNAPAAYSTGALEFLRLFNSDGPLASLESSDIIFQGISAYPNPATDELTASVSIANATRASVYLTDVMGRRYANIDSFLSSGENRINLNVKDIPSGLYFLTVEASAKNKAVTKVVIE